MFYCYHSDQRTTTKNHFHLYPQISLFWNRFFCFLLQKHHNRSISNSINYYNDDDYYYVYIYCHHILATKKKTENNKCPNVHWLSIVINQKKKIENKTRIQEWEKSKFVIKKMCCGHGHSDHFSSTIMAKNKTKKIWKQNLSKHKQTSTRLESKQQRKKFR